MFGVLAIIVLTDWPLGEGLTGHVFVKRTDHTLFVGKDNWSSIRIELGQTGRVLGEDIFE